MARFTANELRRWTAAHGVKRKRGDRKLETARKAIRDNPDAVLRELNKNVKKQRFYRSEDVDFESLRNESRLRGYDGWIMFNRDNSRYVHVGFF